VETTTRFILAALSRGFKATARGMAQQLGLAIMPPGLKFFNAEIFASGTMSGTSSSSLKKEDLSITVHPLLAAIFTYCFDTFEPAQKKAKSISEKLRSVIELTLIVLSPKLTDFPTESREATAKIWFTGNLL
jgi:hypothetical protein